MQIFSAIGFVLFVVGLAVVCANFYYGVLGPSEASSKCRPLIGSLLLWASAVLLVAHPPFMWAALIVSLFDASGPLWYAGVLLWNWLADLRRK